MILTKDERIVLLLYGAETKEESIRKLKAFQDELTGRDRNLRRWTASLLQKLDVMTNAEFRALDPAADFMPAEVTGPGAAASAVKDST